MQYISAVLNIAFQLTVLNVAFRQYQMQYFNCVKYVNLTVLSVTF